jgi:hypothetical protein
MIARLEGARRRLSSEQDARAWLAWHVAALTRAQKMPELGSMFETQKKQGAQTAAEQEIALDQLFLAWGGDPAQLAQMRDQEGRA